MNNLIPTFTDVSDWGLNVYQSTGGTRNKQIVIHPESNMEYFFKGSKVLKDTNEIRYPTEIWSEIISSKIGQLLGFNMLDYNIGYRKDNIQQIGCISASMITHDANKLTEGIAYLTGYRPSYRPNLKLHQEQYSFQFICNALDFYNLEKIKDKIIELIIFDSIVGNSDRHQENWGVITFFAETIEEYNRKLKNDNGFWKKLYNMANIGVINVMLKSHKKNNEANSYLPLYNQYGKQEFSPIYDSGCCLGRELENDKIEKMLKDTQMLEAYIIKGESEIRWDGKNKKQKHFELVELIKDKNKSKVEELINKVNSNINKESISSLIYNIDENLPLDLKKYGLEENRKKLIYKIVDLRLEKLGLLIS